MESNNKYLLNGVKPRNNYSMEILRNTVGTKALDKLKKSITAGKLGPSGTKTAIKRIQQDRKNNTLEYFPNMKSFDVLKASSHSKIEERKEEDEEDIPIESYFAKQGDSDSDSMSDDGGENANKTLAATDTDFRQKDPQNLVDDDLTGLLKLCSGFSEPTEAQLKEKAITFGEKKKPKVLVLDMDETLIHAEILTESSKPIKDSDFTITLKNKGTDGDDETYIVYVKIRPYYDDWLINLSQYYEIVVFTAAEQDYADAILDILDTENLINRRLYRQHCINIEDKYYVKDLRIIEDRDLKDVILVDNSIISMAFNINNGIPVAPFYRWTKNDEELLFLHSYLDELYHVDDAREHNRDKFKLKAIQDGKLKI